MRSTADRIRHALSFEIIALLIAVPGGALIFGLSLHDVGLVAVVSATIATLWNYFYNILFDHALLRMTGRVAKTFVIRLIHTALFEVGLLAALLPFIAWYLGMTLWDAFVLDMSFTIFYLFYTFAFNWLYDIVFPVPGTRHQEHS
ncbi:PACE efflux transporter [Roseovarius pelagicus]|uniref:PACE efflux transporter n=1 Tax=Roseovarius pelagicus TaxID=2980108 RepID=A0ABY6DE20_9RHOB|nr:PACE efflux transporter [Roseovarius pelagicus]UXX83233.1 PACE efflux transporter [Roseovarius pelagicus]